jgi:hypothetical protein
MSEHRTVLVNEISYRGTDGEDHVAHKGDKITIAADGVAHFDWVHDATPEAVQARRDAEAAAADKASKAKPAPKAAAES